MVFIRIKAASVFRLHAKHRKKICRHAHSRDSLRSTRPCEWEIPSQKRCGNSGKCVVLVTPGKVSWMRHKGAAPARLWKLQCGPCELRWIFVGKRPEQH